MAGNRRGTHRRPLSPLRLAAVSGVLIALVAVALRFIPGSPFESVNASSWGHTGDGTSRDDSTSRGQRPEPTPTPTPPPPPPLPVHDANFTLKVSNWYAWALQDTRTGEIWGSDNMAQTNNTASMIKSWLAADFLRRSAEQGKTPTKDQMHTVSIMIRDSDNNAATTMWKLVGKSASITRLVSICKLTDSKSTENNWSTTKVSPRDITRLGACIADGRAAGPKWTDYLLSEMREVRGVGDFGIRKAFPTAEQKTIAIKNGWVVREETGNWEVNCLAIGDGWTMGVMTRYPASKGFEYGTAICKTVATNLRVD